MPENKNLKDNSNTKNNEQKALEEIESKIIAEHPKLFEDVTEEKKEEILKVFLTSFSSVSISESYSGPIPHPDILVKYDSVITDGADRIMKMAENQQSHRIGIESRIINSQSNQSKLG